MTNRILPWFLALSLVLLVACGNNIGRLFDPEVGDGGGDGEVTNVQALPVGGISRDGRPRVVDAFPTGGGWAGTVPIVVIFNETVNEESVAPAAGGGTTVGVRASGTTTNLPATYDFLLGGTVVVVRPLSPLTDAPAPGGPEGDVTATPSTSYDVVVLPDLRDADGTRFGGTEAEVVATFTADAAEDEVDGEIVTILPQDNSEEQLRETPLYAIFSRAANATSVTTTNFFVQSPAGQVTGAPSFPIETAPDVPDTRILRFDPDSFLAGNSLHEIFVDETITFGDTGRLDFRNRSPFSEFRTISVPAPLSVAVGNATMGFDDAVNRSNLANLMVDVQVGADSAPQDRIVARLYGLDPNTSSTDDVNFIERSVDVVTAGAGTVTVDFSNALGTIERPEFSDGDLTITAQTRRGGLQSGYIQSSTTNVPRFDITPPELLEIGPPVGSASTDTVTDQEYLAFYGTASEQLGIASITVGSETGVMYASSEDGRFLIHPVRIGITTGDPVPYSLSLTDRAGNMVLAPIQGNVRQRGIGAGILPGTLTVEVYDDTTFAPVVGATVVIEPGLPTKPATGQVTGTTGADGRVSFPGLGGTSYSVTAIATGFNLTTVVDTRVSYLSLPVGPISSATGTLSGAFVFEPSPNHAVEFSTNVFSDPTTESITTSTLAPTVLPSTAVRPNRPVFTSALAGLFPATSVATFADFGCGTCGADTRTLTPPFAPVGVEAPSPISVNLVSSTGAITNYPALSVDFGSATGLGAIDGDPSVRTMVSLRGVGGMTNFGVGFSTLATGAIYTLQGTYALRPIQELSFFTPTVWISSEASDAAGNTSRVRALVGSASVGNTFIIAQPPGIPTITNPGTVTGSPSVTFEDRIDQTEFPGGFAFTELRAFDPAGRRWSLLWQDSTAAGTQQTIQFPDLSAVSATGLATGVWSLIAESNVYFSSTNTVNGYVLEERFRELVKHARAASVTFTVQ